MECTELSPAGNFEAWEPQRRKELESGHFTSNIGQELLHEGEHTRLWLVKLGYKQRLGFRNISSSFKVMSQTDGFAVSYQGSGKIVLIEFKKADMQRHEVVDEQERIWDLENIGAETLEFIIIEYLF